MGNSNNVAIEQSNWKCNAAFDKFKLSTMYLAIDELKNTIDGQVILPDDSLKYNLARTRPYNIDQQGYPYIIVRVRNTRDVSNCIQFIRKYGEGIKVCVTCGCHSSHCMVSNSFVIDLLNICDVDLNVETKIITVGGGCFLRDVDSVMRPHGLAITLGVKPEVGIGGQVLSGGYGFLSRNHGLSIDQLIEAEVVLADGRIVIANEYNENSDLFWGLRGGGGNFGVVTKFTFQAFKLPEYCYGGNVTYFAPTLESAKAVGKEFDNLIHSQRGKPDGVTGMLRLTAGSSVISTTWSYFGNKSSMNQVPELVRASALKGAWIQLENSLGPRDYHRDLQNLMSCNQMKGHIYQSIRFIGNENRWLPESFFETMFSYIRSTTSPAILKASVCLIALGGGVISTLDDGSKTCVTPVMRHACYYAVIEAYWKPEFGHVGKEQAREWAQNVYQLLNPYKCSGMTHASDEVSHIIPDFPGSNKGAGNGTDMNLYTDWVSEQRLMKLSELKMKFDPTNFFSENANITPAIVTS